MRRRERDNRTEVSCRRWGPQSGGTFEEGSRGRVRRSKLSEEAGAVVNGGVRWGECGRTPVDSG